MLSEYLCTLEPRGGSQLARTLAMCRARCRTHLDVDETMLYPPHISVTGFFSATKEQASGVCAVLQRLLADWRHSLNVDVKRVVSTDTGYVLLDVAAPGIAALATSLADQAVPLGVRLRPKAVRHLSLACCRVRQEQAAIVDIHADVPLGSCAFDLVVSQLLRRSDIESLRVSGQVHIFRELARLSLPGSIGMCGTAPSRMCVGFEAQDVVTPLRKRRAYHCQTGEAPPWREDLADTTPLKVGAPGTLQARESAKVQRLQF